MNNEIFLINKSLENLTKEKDLFGNYEKMSFIKSFLENNVEFVRKNNMIALYGEWGSGKTTIIKSLKNQIDKNKFKSAIFYTWKYEKDDNLAYSLLELLANEFVSEVQKIKFLDIAHDLFIGTLKNINISAGVFGFNVGAIIDNFERKIKTKIMGISLYSKIKDFEKEYYGLINNILNNKNDDNNKLKESKTLLIFIDDLDRCEPKNVLNLLSMLKLFFLFGRESCLKLESKVVYFCGIDREAVKKAINLRYGKMIKAEEYLEKIFDITFYMPKFTNISKFIENSKVFNKNSGEITSFLNIINFKNPRNLKKVLNKYKIVSLVKSGGIKQYKDYIPQIITNKGGYIFDTILVLFFIILYEFFPNKFEELKKYEEKIESYKRILTTGRSFKEGTDESVLTNQLNKYFKAKKTFFQFKNICDFNIYSNKNDPDKENLFKLIHFFSPKIEKNFYFRPDIEYFNQFDYRENEILINFCKYLYEKIEILLKLDKGKELSKNSYDLENLFQMCEVIL